MSQDTETPSPDDAEAPEGIHPEASPFEPGYQPHTLPKISVPELPEDAQGITAEALAQVPTLVDEVSPAARIPAQEHEESAPAEVSAPETEAHEPETLIQDTPVQADTWEQELQVRIGKLTADIHTLNARLDRLAELINTKA